MNVRIASRISNSRGTGKVLQRIRDALLIAGVLILGYCAFILLDTKLYQADQARRFQQQWSTIRPAMANVGGFDTLPVPAIQGDALGKIEISRIGIEAMIVEGIDERTLRRAVGHIPGTPLPGQGGNAALAGHRDTFFRGLRNVRHNDEINLTTRSGSSRYLVDTIQIVSPEDTQVLNDSTNTILTLVTCYPFYFIGPAPMRFIVRAHKLPG